MMNVITLDSAPTLSAFVAQVKAEEGERKCHTVPATSLKMTDDGRLSITTPGLTGEFVLTDQGCGDLASHVQIPRHYFVDCESDLQAYSFNKRREQKLGPDDTLQILIRNDAVDSVRNRNCLHLPLSPILETIQNSIPKNIDANDVRAIPHTWNGEVDLSVIAPVLTCTPVKNDVVTFGINLRLDHKGAVQIQSAAYRKVCSNGAIMRICPHHEQRLRRPVLPTHQEEFLRSVRAFAREAWRHWEDNAAALEKITAVPVYQERYHELRARLRVAPFHLSADAIRRVLRRLDEEIRNRTGGPTLYDLFNALSFVGTHDAHIPRGYGYRLRIGAGEFIRHESRTCSACRQVVFS